MNARLTRLYAQKPHRQPGSAFMSDHARDKKASEDAADFCVYGFIGLLVVGVILKLAGVL